MTYTKEQYSQALSVLVALAKKSKALNPSILDKFVKNVIVDEFYAVASLYANLQTPRK